MPFTQVVIMMYKELLKAVSSVLFVILDAHTPEYFQGKVTEGFEVIWERVSTSINRKTST